MRKLSLAKKRLSTWNNLEKAIKDLSEIMETSKDSEIEDFKGDFLVEIHRIDNTLKDLEFSETDSTSTQANYYLSLDLLNLI